MKIIHQLVGHEYSIVPLAMADYQCCHCCFFSLDLGFFCFVWGSGFLLKIWGFVTVVKFEKCMLYYCIFHSIREYSSSFHRRKMCSVISSQYRWSSTTTSRARLHQIIWNRMIYRLSTNTAYVRMQLQKSLEQYQKIPKSVVVQHKIGVPMIILKIEPNMICKLNWNSSLHTFSYFRKSLKRGETQSNTNKTKGA